MAKKLQTLKKSELLKQAKTMTIQELADKYGVCYQTMHSYLHKIEEYEGKKGRPKSISFED